MSRFIEYIYEVKNYLAYIFIGEDTSIVNFEIDEIHCHLSSDPLPIPNVGAGHLKSILLLVPSIGTAKLTAMMQITHRG